MLEIDPRALVTFHTVAVTGSFSAAARELGWTQPALSQQVKRLELQLGTVLLIRSSKGIELTEAGRILVRHAEIVKGRIQTATSEIGALLSGNSHRVNVVAFPSACTSIVAPAMSLLLAREALPHVEIALEQREPSEVPAAMANGSADVGLVFRYQFEDDQRWTSDFNVEVLGKDPLSVIMAKDDARSKNFHPQEPHRLEDFADERWVSGCTHCQKYLLRITSKSNFIPDIRHNSDDYMVVQALVSQGNCVSLVPGLSLQSFRHPNIEAFGLDPVEERDLIMITRKEEPSESIALVCATIRKSARKTLTALAG